MSPGGRVPPPPAVAGEIERIERQLDDMAARIRRGRTALLAAAPEHSGWSVGQHLDHLLKALKATTAALERSDLPPPAGGLNLLGRLLFLTGRIRRGAAQSPERVRGEQRPPEELETLLDIGRTRLSRLRTGDLPLRPGRCIDHPALGGLTASEALRFVRIHQDHHLRIIREIERLAAAG